MSFKKLKVFIATTLFLIVLLAVSLFLIAYTDSLVFPYLFILFALFWIALFIPHFVSEFSKWDKGLIIFIIILVTLSLTLFANSVKLYSDKNQQMNDLQLQINEIASLNDYYSNYSVDLIKAIKQSEANSNALQDRINKQKQALNENKIQPVEPEIVPPVIEIQNEWEDEEEEDDD